jgi:hypothetical protein
VKCNAIAGRGRGDEQAEKGFSLPEQEQKGALHSHANGWQVVEKIADDFTGRRPCWPGGGGTRGSGKLRYETIDSPAVAPDTLVDAYHG